MRGLYKALSLLGDVKAVSRGPAPFVRRVVRKKANKAFNRALRKVVKP